MNTMRKEMQAAYSGRPLLAVPIISADPEDIIRECEKAASMPCDMIEWRADGYLGGIEQLHEAFARKDFYLDIIKILDDINYIASGRPVILTMRNRLQGGAADITPEHAADIRSLAAESGLCRMVDIELFDDSGVIREEFIREQIEEMHRGGCSVIMSHCDPSEMMKPEEIIGIASEMKRLGADICRIEAMSSSREETESMLRASAFLQKKQAGPIIITPAGEQGSSARVVSGRYGSCMTSAYCIQPSQPGQLDIGTMNTLLDRYYGGKDS